MAKRIYFDSNAASQHFTQEMLNTAEDILDSFRREATQGLENFNDTKTELPKEIKGFIIGKVFFYADAIMESYGTGSLIDRNNPFLSEYINNANFNRFRDKNNLYIAARKHGEPYTNIYGEKQVGGGNNPGFNLEKTGIEKYQPKSPKYTIQQAEDWYVKDSKLINSRIDETIRKFLKNINRFFSYR